MRKRNTTKLMFGLSCLVLIGTTTKVIAGTYLYGNYVPQAKTNWCWAATAQNANIWEKNTERDQWSAVHQLKGSNTNPYPDAPGSLADSVAASEFISYGLDKYDKVETSKSYKFLVNKINQQHCVSLGAGYYNFWGRRVGGHIVLMCGYTTINSSNAIRYYDSGDGGSMHICTYSDFCDGDYNGRKYDGTVFHK